MVKLSDDCFAHDCAPMTVAEAFEQIQTRLAPLVEAENAPVRAVVGRVLAQDVVARMNLPPHANSAVDGYAVVHSDLFPKPGAIYDANRVMLIALLEGLGCV